MFTMFCVVYESIYEYMNKRFAFALFTKVNSRKRLLI